MNYFPLETVARVGLEHGQQPFEEGQPTDTHSENLLTSQNACFGEGFAERRENEVAFGYFSEPKKLHRFCQTEKMIRILFDLFCEFVYVSASVRLFRDVFQKTLQLGNGNMG